MSSSSPIPPFNTDDDAWWCKGSSGLTQQFCSVSHFFLALRLQLRFGELSRAPLRLIRLQIKETHAECDWIARTQDP